MSAAPSPTSSPASWTKQAKDNRPPTPSSHRHSHHHHHHKSKLIRNRRGRALFLGLSASWLVLTAVALAAVVVHRADRFVATLAWAITALMGVGLTAVLTIILALAPRMFRWRGLNAIGYLVLGVVTAVAVHRADGPWMFSIPLIISCVAQFVMISVLVPSSQSKLALYMHPFVDDRLYAASLQPAGSASRYAFYAASANAARSPASTSSEGGSRAPRKVSIFRDWPAPVPFPAKALYGYPAKSSSELNFHKGDPLTILDCRGNWWQARHPGTGSVGFVPSNFIGVLQRAKVIESFTASGPDEVSILEGQVVEVMEQHENMSLVRSSDARIGSVYSKCLQLLAAPEEADKSPDIRTVDKENLPPPKFASVSTTVINDNGQKETRK
jgi:hypothetical protein